MSLRYPLKMIRRFYIIFPKLLIFACLLSVLQAFADKAQKVEDLYIWKVSDELKFSTKQEQEFAKLIRDLNFQKSNLTLQIQKNMDSMKGKKEKSLKAIFEEYKKNLSTLQQLNLKEVNMMEKKFGLEKTAQYIQLKQTLADEIRSALTDLNKKSSEK